MDFDVDVAIIGAGPVGSTIANYLLENDLSVCLIEKKKDIGYPLQCAGILSTHINELNDLPEEVILNKVKGAFLHTENQILNVKRNEDVAYIIDRIAYDKYLSKKAIDAGARFINSKAIDFDLDEGYVFLNNGNQIKAKVIIGCDGYNSSLSKKFKNRQINFNASQILVEITDDNINSFRSSDENVSDFVDTYLMEDILPGFIWLIPLKNNLYRLGLFSKDSHKIQDKILTDFSDKILKGEIREKYKGFIPIFQEENEICQKRAILIGDAASQIKPTSGGGLSVAFDACQIASEKVISAVKNDDVGILKEYEKEFNKKYQKEFNYQIKVQKTLNILSDDDLDYLFGKLKENNGEELISKYGDMDTQSVLVKEFIKRGLIFKIIPSFFIKKVSKIFGFR